LDHIFFPNAGFSSQLPAAALVSTDSYSAAKESGLFMVLEQESLRPNLPPRFIYRQFISLQTPMVDVETLHSMMMNLKKSPFSFGILLPQTHLLNYK